VSVPSAQAAAWALKQACYDAWQRDPAAARAAAIELAQLATAHPDDALVQTLSRWTGGIAALGTGQLERALQHLQAAQAGFEAAGDALHAAQTQVPQVAVLAMLGRHDAAQRCGAQALARFVAAGDEASAGKIELNLGSLLMQQERHADAEPFFRRAAARSAHAGDVQLSVMADGALANALAWQHRFEPARQMFERTRLRAEARGLPLLAAQALQGLGQIELHRGRWHLALPALVAAAEHTAAAGAPPQRCIEADTALADAYLAVNLLDEAARLYARVVDAALALPAPTDAAWAALHRARALARQGDLDGAAADLERAHDLYTELANPAMLGLIALTRGRLALQAAQAAPALACAEQALALLAGAVVPAWTLEAQVLAAEATIAAGSADAAHAVLNALLPQVSELPQLAWRCHAALGEIARRQGDAATARSALERALGLIETARAALGDDELRLALGADADTVQPALVALALQADDSAALLQTLERGRARALAMAVAGARPDEPGGGAGDGAGGGAGDGAGAIAGVDAAAAGQASATADAVIDGAGPGQAVDDAATRLHWLRQRWQQAVSQGDAARVQGLGRQVLALENDLLDTLRRKRLRAAAPANGPLPPAPGVDLAALQSALGPGRALVAFDCREARLLACVVTHDAVFHRAWAAPELEPLLRSLALQLDGARRTGPSAERHRAQRMARTQAVLQALHAAVWAPIAPLLRVCPSLVLLPHQRLHPLPFAALHDGAGWLVERHALQFAPSAAVWLALQRRPPQAAAGPALVMAVGGDALPGVRQEAAVVAAAWAGPVELLLENAATLAAWRRHAPHARLLHLAGHAQFRADNPAFSHLALADGPLAMFEVAGVRLQAELATLSACDTGIGQRVHGDEGLGLVRAFLVAGAANVMATLWPIADAAAAQLAGDFHAAWRRGLTPVEALQQAQQVAIRSGANPVDWAGTLLHGRGR
jgi:hypothetical protein